MSTRAATAADASGSRRAVAVVVAVVFVDLLGFGVIIPVLPFYVRSFGVSDVFIGLLAASPLAGTDALFAGGPAWLSGGLVALLAFGALASFGNGSITVGLAALVSSSATAEAQGSAFGVTQGAGSLGRTVGPPLAAAAYVAAYWSPFVAGALVLVPVVAVLRMRA